MENKIIMIVKIKALIEFSSLCSYDSFILKGKSEEFILSLNVIRTELKIWSLFGFFDYGVYNMINSALRNKIIS